MSDVLDLSAHAEATCSVFLGDERVLPLMLAWAGVAKQALDGRGFSCLVMDDELTLENVPFGQQYVLGLDVWDADKEFAWRLRLELFCTQDPNVVGHTEVTARFGVGAFDPDSELDTWLRLALFAVAPHEPPPAGRSDAKIIAGQALTKLVQWHNRQAPDAFAQMARQIDEVLRP